MRKSDLPSKTCLTCGRPFNWRKKWARSWAEVKYCSEACKRKKASPDLHLKSQNLLRKSQMRQKVTIKNQIK